MAAADEFYLRYYVGHQGKFGHEFLEFEFRPDGKVRPHPSHMPPRARPNPPRRVACDATCAALLPQASMAMGGLPGSWISQKPSPPMAFMCG